MKHQERMEDIKNRFDLALAKRNFTEPGSENYKTLSECAKLILNEYQRAWRNYYLTNPDNKYMAYGSNKAAFRKSSGTAEKMVNVAEKFFSRLYESIKADYLGGRIHKDHREYVKANIEKHIKEESK